MDENENSLPINEIEEDTPKQETQGFFWTKQKKLLIVLFIAIIVLVLYFIIISSYLSNEEEKKDEEDNGGKEEGGKTEILGRIYSTFTLYSDEIKTNILNENFEIPKNFDIYIDDQKINYTKDYKLSGEKTHNVTFVLYDELNMKNMLKMQNI